MGLIAVAWLAACSAPPERLEPAGTQPIDAPTPPALSADTSGDEPMDAMRFLFRASLDLRGVRPTFDEILQVERNADSLGPLIELFLHDERFGDRIVDMFGEIYQTQLDTLPVYYDVADPVALARSVGEEPLRMLAHIAMNDLPYPEIVTADWTMADERIAEVWPVSYPGDGVGWQQVRYTDDRIQAGILSSNALWWRYPSTYSNANRGRANAISKILLCTDYLSKPIHFDRNVDLLDAGALNEALRTNDGCVGCHYSLDPLAAYLWGFYYNYAYSAVDATYYHPEREFWWDEATGVEPGYFGQPGYSLRDLGWQIAGDHRLPMCMAEQMFEQLVQRDVALADTATLIELRDAFVRDGLTLRSLARNVVWSDAYRSGSDEGIGTPWKLTRPALLASQIEGLTGFRFTSGGADMLGTDSRGLRTLAGGVDGGFVTAPAPEVNATMGLVYERLAEAAAHHVVAHDRALPQDRRLFAHVGFTETPESNPALMAEEVQNLHLRLFGRRVDADGPEVEANLELWQDLYELDGDASAAWAGVLAVLFRDPLFLFY